MEALLLANPYKQRELELISLYITPDYEMNRRMVILEGPPNCGKTYTIKQYMTYLKSVETESLAVGTKVVNCKYVFGVKGVMKSIIRCLGGDKGKNEIADFGFNLISLIKSGLNNSSTAIIIVLENLDLIGSDVEVREISNILNEVLKNYDSSLNKISFIVTCYSLDKLGLKGNDVPNVLFKPFTKEQLKEILTKKLGNILLPEKMQLGSDVNRTNIFKQFVSLMLDTYENLGTNMTIIEPVIKRIWPIFLDPIVRLGHYEMGQNDILTTFLNFKPQMGDADFVFRDFKNTSKQLVNDNYNQDPLLTKLLENLDMENYNNGNFDLSKRVKYMVIASFLASFNEPKYDSIFFTKDGTTGLKVKRRRNINRKSMNNSQNVLRREMSIAQPFSIERFLAILKSIWLENEEGEEQLEMGISVLNDMSSLSSLGIIVKMNIGDTIGGGTKWKCNVHWDIVEKFSNDLKFNILDFVQD